MNQDSIWVIVDHLTKSSYFLAINVLDSIDQLARLYVREVIKLHGILISIISDRNPMFTSRFWKSLQQAMAMKLNFSITLHPQMDRQTERTIQILDDILPTCVIDIKRDWEEVLPLIEFIYNNSYHASLGMAPYEALYSRPCRSLIYWDEVGERQLFGPKLVEETTAKVSVIRKNLQTAQSRQKGYADNRRINLAFEMGDHVFLKVSPMKGLLRFEKKEKLSSCFVEPFEIFERVGTVAYSITLL